MVNLCIFKSFVSPANLTIQINRELLGCVSMAAIKRKKKKNQIRPNCIRRPIQLLLIRASSAHISEEDSKPESTLPPSPIVEVLCKSSRKTSRFAVGSKAGFAVSLINRKLEDGAPIVLYIEAVKDGEEPVSFGPDAVLVNYGDGWKLQTVTELDYGCIRKKEHVQLIPTQILNKVRTSDGTHSTKAVVKPGISFLYIAKILVAFGLIFVLGAIFTLALENLPRLLLFVNTLT